MRKNWMLLGIALLVAVLAFGAVACGGDGDGPDEDVSDDLVDEKPDTVIVSAGVLADSEGNTLYVFDDDEAGVSNCAGDCAVTWPPLTVDGDPTAGDGVGGTLASIDRDDDTTQVTYNDQPLYYYSGEAGLGDQSGDGRGDGVWHMVVIGSAD